MSEIAFIAVVTIAEMIAQRKVHASFHLVILLLCVQSLLLLDIECLTLQVEMTSTISL